MRIGKALSVVVLPALFLAGGRAHGQKQPDRRASPARWS